MMTLNERIDVLVRLGEYILAFDERLGAYIHRTAHANPWFTVESQNAALRAIAKHYLDREALEQWVDRYERKDSVKTIGLVAAGNIPAVAFHDLLSVFVTGNRAQIKLSERDPYLLPFLVKVMTEYDDRAEGYFDFVDKLNSFDAVIATGSNNSARYFEQYFGKYPNIIRRNRNAIALLSGDETEDQLRALATDVFEHFGLGCRNVSHLSVPKGFDLETLRTPFQKYASIIDHAKYRNNFDYNMAIAIMNREDHINLGNVLLKPSDKIISPIGCLHYSQYDSFDNAVREFMARADEIQCVVTRQPLEHLRSVDFGHAQSPQLDDYADGVDTMQFLTSL